MERFIAPGLASWLSIFSVACDLDSVLSEPAAHTPRAALPIASPTETPHSEVTSTPVALPADFDAILQAVTRALGGGNANGFSAWLANEVSFAPRPGVASTETLTPEVALARLNARWGGRHNIVEKQFVEHFVRIDLVTDGWAKIAPIQNGVIELHLHRCNLQGQGDRLGGRWRIATILYE